MNDLQKFQFYDKYARFLPDENRLETFEEAVDRSISHAQYVTGGSIRYEELNFLKKNMLDMAAFPSLRWFQTAGLPARRHPQSIFNCSYLPIDSIESFTELMFLLGLGVGVGFSVESQNVLKLPVVHSKKFSTKHEEDIVVEDSLEGWVGAIGQVLDCLFSGELFKVDYSKVRKSGVPLKIRGGTASGPKALKNAIDGIEVIFNHARGRRLRPIEAHDICCHLAEAIVSGGVRRSAMISLFDEFDSEMMKAKTRNNMSFTPRAMANNSFVITGMMNEKEYHGLVDHIFENGSGEPGIFSRYAAQHSKETRDVREFGCNPCGELVLRPLQFCNLSQVIVRENDTVHSLFDKVKAATMWGIIQASVDNFTGLRADWSKNQIQERLCGVDLNGILDNEIFSDEKNRISAFTFLKEHADLTAASFSASLGLAMNKDLTPAGLTTNKPAGNSSVLFDCASGISARFAPYYVRRVTVAKNSKMSSFLIESNVPFQQSIYNEQSYIFEFPVKSPNNAITRDTMTAKEQLDIWADAKIRWNDYNPSVTVLYQEHETSFIKDWLYDNQDIVSGISFLPKDDNIYPQAPYLKIGQIEYEHRTEAIHCDWEKFEATEAGNGGREFACVGDSCSL